MGKWPSILHLWCKCESKNGPELDTCKSKLPDGAFDSAGNVSAKQIMENGLVDAVDGVCPESIIVEYDKTKFTLTIESWGQLSGTDTVAEALNNLLSELDSFQEATEVLK